jgi:hypothetical protein
MRNFCDQICAQSLAALAAARAHDVCVLDAVSDAQRVLAARAGIAVSTVQFFAGHLRDAEGEAIYMTARRRAGVVALEAARRLVATRPLAETIDRRYGRSTVRLALAKWLVTPIEAVLVRVAAARVLAGSGPVRLWLVQPTFDTRLIGDAFESVDVRFYSGRRPWGVPLALRGLAAQWVRRAWSWLVPVRVAPDPGPSLLMVREDDVHIDRSHRGQPHWLEPEQCAPPFHTYIANRGGPAFTTAPARELEKFGVRCLGRGEVARARLRHRADPTLRALRRDAWSCTRAALAARGHGRAEYAQLAVLLWRAEEMAALARYLGVRTYLFGEPYLIETDAMQIAAADGALETIAYQYSNLAFMSPLMLSTADRMVLFSEVYRPLWEADGIAPRRCEVAGYVFDGAVARVRERSQAVRARLVAAGANFVICYFDENVQYDRWGCVHPDDHLAELRALATLLVADAGLALVVKSQFERNSPSRLYAGDPAIERARATGRYVELCAGIHRNNVLPAEAALCADLCIGHLIGATASLEAGLAGVRSTLLNPTGLRTANDALYARADIVYPSMEELLAAIAAHRAGDPARGALGDWQPIAGLLDPFRDGRASLRLRALVERSVMAGAPRSVTVDSEETV